ncbi:MAG TPA: hypothetical protein VGB78_02435 [Thermoplasmata archaeon]|jgi:hypothetical protein
MSEEKHDAQEVKEILQVVATEIPKLLESISNTMYKSENAENFGKSIAVFYKQMKDSGMDDKQAYALTQQYMNNFSLGGMISSAMSGRKITVDTDDISEEVEERIRKKIKKKLGDDEDD